MPRFKPDEDSWALYQSIGTWMLAVGLLSYEAVVRHFQDSGGLTLLGGLLGLPIIRAFEENRRERHHHRDTDDED